MAWKIRALLLLGLLEWLFAGRDQALAQLSLSLPPTGGNPIGIALPSITTPAISVPALITVPGVSLPTVALPAVSVPGINLLTITVPTSLNLPIGQNTLLINLSGVSILVPNLPQLATLGVVLDLNLLLNAHDSARPGVCRSGQRSIGTTLALVAVMRRGGKFHKSLIYLVGVAGLEPATR